MSEWISVKDRLPELDARYASDEVIIYVQYYDSGCPTIGYYIIDTWYSLAMVPIESRYAKVTHWMPYPESPTEVD